MSRALGLLLCLSNLALVGGCAAQQRRAAGATLVGVGALTALAGVVVAVGCTPSDPKPGYPTPGYTKHDSNACEPGEIKEHPEIGVPLTFFGFGTALAGGLVYAAEID